MHFLHISNVIYESRDFTTGNGKVKTDITTASFPRKCFRSRRQFYFLVWKRIERTYTMYFLCTIAPPAQATLLRDLFSKAGILTHTLCYGKICFGCLS